MNWRKLNRFNGEDVAAMVVGATVASRFFDPNGPGAVDNMSLLEGTVVKVDGDPMDSFTRNVWVRTSRCNGRELPWYEKQTIDFFGGDLWLPVVAA
jgi:hypothetical protein